MEVSIPSEQRSFQYGSTRFEYQVVWQERKHLRITVHPDRRIEIRCPYETTDADITDVVRRRASWIIDQLDFFLSFEPRYTLKQYVPGESHMYLGRQYRLRWIEQPPGLLETCVLRGAFFEVSCASRADI